MDAKKSYIPQGSDGIAYIGGVRFYTCSLLEYLMTDLEAALPSAEQLTLPFWSFCKRGEKMERKMQSELKSLGVLHNEREMSK